MIVVLRVGSDQLAVQFGFLGFHAARGRRRDLAALGQIEVRRRQLTNGRTRQRRQQHRDQRPAAHRAGHGDCVRVHLSHPETLDACTIYFVLRVYKKTDITTSKKESNSTRKLSHTRSKTPHMRRVRSHSHTCVYLLHTSHAHHAHHTIIFTLTLIPATENTHAHTLKHQFLFHCSLYILVTVFPGTRSILFWEDHPFGSVFSAQLTRSSPITGLRGGPSVFGVRVCGSCMCVRVCWSCVCTHVCVYVVENYPLYVFLKIVCACVGLYIL